MNKRKSFIILIFVIVFIFLLTGTFAFFTIAANGSGSNVITGNTATMRLSLEVTPLISHDNDILVPLLDNARYSAVSGGCIDANNNLSCQIYEIKIKNDSSINVQLHGSLELIAVDSGNFENLKWTLMDDSNVVGSNSVNGMDETNFDSNVSLNSSESSTYYLLVWLSEADLDQSLTDYGNFNGIVKFEDENGDGATAKFEGSSQFKGSD